MKHVKSLYSLQAAKYIGVASIGYVFDLSVLIFLYEVAGIHYSLAVVGGFVIGLIVQYILSDKLVFGESKIDSKSTEMTAFAVIGAVGLAILSVFMWVFVSLLGINYIVAKIISTIFVFIWNFLARRSLYHS